MFNQPNSSRSAIPWQPIPERVSDDARHGFASTEWMRLQKAGFADAGFKPKITDYAADQYQSVSMPLSEKSRKTLALMGEVDAEEELAADGNLRREPESPNAHLPFVLDVYGVKKKAKPASSTVADESAVQTTHVAEALEPDTALDPESDLRAQDAAAAEIATSDEPAQDAQQEALSELPPEHLATPTHEPDESDAQALTQPDAQEDEPIEAETDEAELVAAQPQALDASTSEAETEQDLTESDLVSDDHSAEPQALATEIEEVLAQASVPTPVMQGIDPEEVAQREAEHFERGLAQGIEQGERQAREAMQQEVAAQCAVLSSVTQDLNALLQDPKKFFEPLKRLAIHVAEHVVMKELSTSPEAIERLVQRCLDELDHPAQGAVVLELNPQDKARLQAQGSALVAGMRLDAVPDMKPGSVRLFANDTVVEDLVEHRLEALARSLSVDVPAWREQSTLAQPDADAPSSESEIEDVEPNDVHP